MTTPRARRVRNSVYAALKEAGVDEARLAQTERLISTVILGFAVSEAAGRFRRHSGRQLDADFAQLQGLLARFIESESQTVVDEGANTEYPNGATIAPRARIEPV